MIANDDNLLCDHIITASEILEKEKRIGELARPLHNTMDEMLLPAIKRLTEIVKGIKDESGRFKSNRKEDNE